ncbi:hypothetical protein [Mammaliicoccus sp. N-M51]|uniref:hypothetical protein n=1 Tax=Mammaliicoccus sp. N-M51 TaxID=2898710 RepID=UPI001EFB358A|nr:hypothetical protein [Mammaliicoccus sp. N-M51]
MYKQVFDYNGNPYLVKTNEDGELSQEDLKKQDLYQYTEIMPPSKFFPPRQFDGEKWHGALAEIPPTPEPSDVDFLNAQLISNDIEHNAKIETLQQDIANLTNELLEMKGGMSDVSDS